MKDWIFSIYSALNSTGSTNDSNTDKLEHYLLYCFYIIKDVCRFPPRNIFKNFTTRQEILYVLLDYYIILNEVEFFQNSFNLIVSYCEKSNISYKFYVILKKFIIKYFNSIISEGGQSNVNSSVSIIGINSLLTSSNSNQIIIVNPTTRNSSSTLSNNNTTSNLLTQNSTSISVENTMFRKFIDFTLNALKTNIKEVNKSSNSFTLFGLLFNSKKNMILSKELDGTNIIEFFTILNICEEYSTNHINNMIVFSVSFELFKFLFFYYNKLILKNESNDRIVLILKDMKSILHSYCIRIFDQCENYLQSNKNKNEIDKNTQYNLNLIEVSINLIIKLNC